MACSTKRTLKIGQGRVWTGLRANKIGLVDELGGIQDALQIASELAELENYQIIEYPKEKTALEIILDDLENIQANRGKTIEEIYKVKVQKLNSLNVKSKPKVFKGQRGTRSELKRIIVTLKEGNTIDMSGKV